MEASTFSPPVAALLKLGRPPLRNEIQIHYDVEREHVPELIRMALDTSGLDDDRQDDDAENEPPELFAQVHAWRALGQLRATEAIAPLISLLRRVDEADDDW